MSTSSSTTDFRIFCDSVIISYEPQHNIMFDWSASYVFLDSFLL